MGIYFNMGTGKFNSALRSKIYIDKTGFLEYTNSVLATEDRYICLSRPRRFGKSITAAMLAAYYGKGADSSALFDDKKIAQSADYQKYRNKYDVIQIDMNVFLHRLDMQNKQSVSASDAVILFQKEVVAGNQGYLSRLYRQRRHRSAQCNDKSARQNRLHIYRHH